MQTNQTRPFVRSPRVATGALVALQLTLALALVSPASAQLMPEWAVQRNSGSIGGTVRFGSQHTVTTDTQGAIYVTGFITDPAGRNTVILTFKLAPDGTELWASLHPPTQPGLSESAEAITIDSAGNVIVIRTGAWDVIKYDPADGSEIWFVNINTGGFGGPHALTTDAAGNIYITGESTLPGGSRADFFTVKLDSAGNILWTARYAGPGAFLFAVDVAVDIALDSNGGVLVTGPSPPPGRGSPTFVTIKYRASDGAQLWLARLDLNGAGASPVALLISSQDDVYVTGTGSGSALFPTVKYNGNDGSQIWLSVNLGAFIFGQTVAMALDSQGDVYVTGRLDPDGNRSNQNDNIVTMRLRADTGARRWLSIYGENQKFQLDDARAIVIDAQDNVYVTGRTSSFGAANDLILLLYDAATGQIVDQGTFDVPAQTVVGQAVVLDSAQNAIVAGRSGKLLILKYPAQGGCYPDCDANGTLDIFDFLCFQNSFVAGEPYACGCDPDPVCDVFDFLCFQNAFVAGCP